ncbi:pimeloyl-ACP methyl ester carboxylesterase [Nocardia tenerifensis]|uniref:Pimeloyl-ACP methyl ester carboxylesterase n=1 Tax=Nocardia tenerifensis TaxID=228006 RepID=A0A318K8X6_9NOCA|nr:alpha/beta hydrolase [Nocardia tenerifensis]PXX60873.1 pimeloyl-ACP methyl ester carboxylesterase [Nocardia tenerifensis]
MIVFLHGVPETAAAWRKVRAAIDAESVALTLPGFDGTRPDGFTSSKDEYVDWVADQLDRYDTVDLVGHDWGAGLVYRLAMTRPLRSWVADNGAFLHPDAGWHSLAQTWRTPGDGETAIASLVAMEPDAFAEFAAQWSLSKEDAREMAEGFTEAMGASILSLYRSVTSTAYAEWGPLTPTDAPGLVLDPVDDEFSDETKAREVAAALGARFQRIEGAGHFWPYQAPERTAEILVEFWSSL